MVVYCRNPWPALTRKTVRHLTPKRFRPSAERARSPYVGIQRARYAVGLPSVLGLAARWLMRSRTPPAMSRWGRARP